MKSRSDRTYVENVKNPGEALLQNCDRIFVVLRVEGAGYCTAFTMLNNLPLDLCHSSATEGFVNEPLSAGIAGLTHVVSCSIAPDADWLSSSNRLPFNPRLRASQTSKQNSPMSTYSRSFTIESWTDVGEQPIVAEAERTVP